jgi:ATP-dependent helicase/nuclease subunit A
MVSLGHGVAGEGLRLARGVAGTTTRVDSFGRAEPDPLPEWARAAIEPEDELVRPRAPSRLGEAEPTAGSPSGADAIVRYRFGLHVHKLLQLLPDLPLEARAAALARYLRRIEDLEPTLVEHIRDNVMAVLGHPELQVAFGPGSRAEQAICGVIGGIPIAGQIDRVAVTADQILLLDYKTSRRPPAFAAETPVAYLRQMAAYRELLRQIYPNRPIKAALVWTETGKVTWLETAVLDPHIPDRMPVVASSDAP